MAKECYWYGFGNGATNQGEWDYDDSGGGNANSNWRTVGDDVGCAKPAVGDTVHIDSRAYLMADGVTRQDITDNIDAAGTGTPDLAGLIVGPDYNGTIGASDEYLEIECSAGDIVIRGPATMYLKCSAGASADSDVARLVVANSQAAVYLKSVVNSASYVALYALIWALGGAVEIADDTAITKLILAGDDAAVTGGTGCVNVKTDPDTATTIDVVKGALTWDSPIADAQVFDGGTFNWGTDLDTAEAGLDCDLVTVYPNGRFNWRCRDAAISILTKFIVYPYGIFDAKGPTSSAYLKQIGTGSGEISEVWEKGKLYLDSGNSNLLLGSGSSILNHGGIITAPGGENISW